MDSQNKTKFNRATVLEIAGIVLSSALLIIAFCGRYFGGGFKDFANFFVGSFGMSFYGILIAVIVACSCLLAGKKILIPAKYAAVFATMYVIAILLVHMFTTTFLSSYSYETYVSYCYNYYDGVPTFGGVVWGSVSFALQKALTVYGAAVLLFIALAVTVFFAGEFFYSYATGKISLVSKKRNTLESSEEFREQDEMPSRATLGVATGENDRKRENAINILFQQQSATEVPEKAEISRSPKIRSGKFENAPQSSFDATSPLTPDILFSDPAADVSSRKKANSFFDDASESEDDFIVRGFFDSPAKIEEQETVSEVVREPFMRPNKASERKTEQRPSEKSKNDGFTFETEKIADVREHNSQIERIDVADIFAEDVEDNYAADSEKLFTGSTNFESDSREDDYLTAEIDEDLFEKESVTAKNTVKEDTYTALEVEVPVDGGLQVGFDFVETEKYKKQQEKVHQYLKYEKPPVELLDDAVITEDFESDDRRRCAEAIVKKLAVFGIKTEALEPVVGPSVTRYLLRVLSDRTRMNDFKAYSDDLKSCLEAKDDIRIEAPVPGTNLVGIEVANKVKTPVVLRTVVESETFKNAKGRLVFAVGQEITGKMVVADLAEMPHLLIAGTTGSGKSVCLNDMIVSLMYKYSPEYVRFLMVDPKFVELSRYNGSPHLLTSEAITTVQDALAGMDYLIGEMESRFQLFKQNLVGNISEYNQKINPKYTQKLPYLVLVVDELADLMAASKKSFETKIMRLAQKSRAAGIHIVLATQRPSVDIITGTIKANLSCRMALKVVSFADSKTILDCSGAEKLLGKGDMLLMDSGSPAPFRVQGAYVSNNEIRNLVEFCKNQNEVYYENDIAEKIFVSKHSPDDEESVGSSEGVSAPAQKELDPYCRKALEFWLNKNGGKASIASIQRSLSVGFNRAGKIFDSLVTLGYVEELPANEPGSKPRRVLISIDRVEELFPDMEGY